MTEAVDLYGFGSFFSAHGSAPRDIDILILHRIDRSSIDFAIQCKTAIRNPIRNADVVLLSESEEQELAFLRKCRGKLLGTVTDTSLSDQLEAICRAILVSSSPLRGSQVV
jgi:hypothetical protein